nr:MAG TPA: hypothetical protein [Caudoviricetes sp.]
MVLWIRASANRRTKIAFLALCYSSLGVPLLLRA